MLNINKKKRIKLKDFLKYSELVRDANITNLKLFKTSMTALKVNSNENATSTISFFHNKIYKNVVIKYSVPLKYTFHIRSQMIGM